MKELGLREQGERGIPDNSPVNFGNERMNRQGARTARIRGEGVWVGSRCPQITGVSGLAFTTPWRFSSFLAACSRGKGRRWARDGAVGAAAASASAFVWPLEEPADGGEPALPRGMLWSHPALIAGTPRGRTPRVADEELPGETVEVSGFCIDEFAYPNERARFETGMARDRRPGSVPRMRTAVHRARWSAPAKTGQHGLRVRRLLPSRQIYDGAPRKACERAARCMQERFRRARSARRPRGMDVERLAQRAIRRSAPRAGNSKRGADGTMRERDGDRAGIAAIRSWREMLCGQCQFG
jgi:hypothetical protein